MPIRRGWHAILTSFGTYSFTALKLSPPSRLSVDFMSSDCPQSATQETIDLLKQVRQLAVIGFVGGSDLPKITEQLAIHGQDGTSHLSPPVAVTTELRRRSSLCSVTQDFDYCFAENGLTAFKLGQPLSSQSFIQFLGEDKYKLLVKFVLHYIADLDIPVKRLVTADSSGPFGDPDSTFDG